MTTTTTGTTDLISRERLKQTQFELASMAYEARGSGRDSYDRSSLLSLLIVMQHEFERSLILSSTVACAANALDAGGVNVKPRALTRYFPTESAQLTLAILRMKKWFGDRKVCGLIDQFKEAQAFAKQQTIACAASGFTELPRYRTGQTVLAMGWRQACAAGHVLLEEIDRELGKYNIHGAANEASNLLTLLEKVIEGQWTLVGASGDVVMPDWAEQREFPRIPVRCAAVLECRGRAQNVILRDMSTTGVGIQSVSDVKAGDVVTVKTCKALTFKGQIVWAEADRAGVLLNRPLHANDPGLEFLNGSVDGSAAASSNAGTNG